MAKGKGIRISQGAFSIRKKTKRIEQKQVELKQASQRLAKKLNTAKPATSLQLPPGRNIAVYDGTTGKLKGYYVSPPPSAFMSHPTLGRKPVEKKFIAV